MKLGGNAALSIVAMTLASCSAPAAGLLDARGGDDAAVFDGASSDPGDDDSAVLDTTTPTWLSPVAAGLEQLLSFAALGDRGVIAISWGAGSRIIYTRVDSRGAPVSKTVTGKTRGTLSPTRCGDDLCVVGQTKTSGVGALVVDRVSVGVDGELSVMSREFDPAFEPLAPTSSVSASRADPPELLAVDDALGIWRRCTLADDVDCVDLAVKSPCDPTSKTQLNAFDVDGTRAFVAGTCSNCGDTCAASGGVFLIEVDLQSGLGTFVVPPETWPGRLSAKLIQNATHVWLLALWLPNGSSDSEAYSSASSVLVYSKEGEGGVAGQWDGPTQLGLSEVSALGAPAPEGIFMVSTDAQTPALGITSAFVDESGGIVSPVGAPLSMLDRSPSFAHMLSLVATDSSFLGAIYENDRTWIVSFDQDGMVLID